ncbi:PREDICTED: uncharacterized protein LOC108378663 [Rhagoletis zephyria]|uniref:uncharacterized protein LOC108378663 n=1 Tax=Rhagoletis zephyria TaxID=28612 RepID=UPI0008112B8F|nr:PREDICTED: uncharacterized protein LOC108378663 [Rhagoletis zephyria]
MLVNRIIQATNGASSIIHHVNRGTPQGGVLSPLLWVIALNGILLELNRGGVKVVAYTDDVVIAATGPFLSTVSEILEGTLGRLHAWATRSGLNVNPAKTELILFTNRHKLPQFKLPSLDGKALSLTPSAKYLGVVLDNKLNWKANVEFRRQKAYIAYYTCQRIFSRNWGLNPKLVMWMYTAIIRPILTYGALVWWPGLSRQYNVSKLRSIQRAASAGVTGAILNLIPIDLHLKEVAMKSAVRLRESGLWRTRHFGHGLIINQMQLNRTTDYIVGNLDFSCNVQVLFPSRRDWRRDRVAYREKISLYTNGSKMDCGVGAGVYSKELGVALSLRLGNNTSIFQAEVLGILEACKILGNRVGHSGKATIYSDSQAALLAIASPVTKSKLVGECKVILRSVSQSNTVSLVWVPGHRNIEGNEKADELAKAGAGLDESQAVALGCPLGVVQREITTHFLELARRRWSDIQTCKIARKLWPDYNRAKTLDLLSRSRPEVFRILATITGHWPIGKHAAKIGLPHNMICRSCQLEDSEESVQHLLCECPGLSNIRHKTLGKHLVAELTDLSGATISEIGRFIRQWKWFDLAT